MHVVYLPIFFMVVPIATWFVQVAVRQPWGIYRIMHELPWITIFGHKWGDLPLANHITSDKKLLFTVTNVLFISYMLFYVLNIQFHLKKNNNWSPISPFSLGAIVSDLALWPHHNWFVMTCDREVLALRHHIRQLFLHAQIGTKAIFTSD